MRRRLPTCSDNANIVHRSRYVLGCAMYGHALEPKHQYRSEERTTVQLG